MRLGMLSMSEREYSTRLRIIHGPVSASTAAMASSFGMNDRVISLICVAAWKMPTMRPTASAVSSSGAESIRVISSAWRPMVTTVSGVMAGSPEERLRERAHDQRPAVDQHEQHDLEGQRDEYRRQHHHAHGHEDARHHEIDDHERDEQQEADLERRLELAGDERWHQDADRHVFLLLEAL